MTSSVKCLVASVDMCSNTYSLFEVLLLENLLLSAIYSLFFCVRVPKKFAIMIHSNKIFCRIVDIKIMALDEGRSGLVYHAI